MALRRTRQRADPFQVLGLGPDASAADVRRARTQLAKHHHPDVGGSAADMQRVNEAADLALRLLGATVPALEAERPTRPRPAPGGGVGRDHPSFSIEALPAEAFEALLIVANVLGEVVDDDPPYQLEVHLTDPPSAWCRIELFPEGGGSIVGLTVMSTGASTAGATVNDVRDRLVIELNRLDWSHDGPRPPLPS